MRRSVSLSGVIYCSNIKHTQNSVCQWANQKV